MWARPYLHSLTSAIVGYYWALGIARRKVARYLIPGFIAATAIHATFNYLILNYGDVIYAVVFLVVIGFFVLHDFEKLKKQPLDDITKDHYHGPKRRKIF